MPPSTRKTFSIVFLPLLLLIPMARYPNAVEKKVLLTGHAATAVAKLFGLSSAGSVSLPLSEMKAYPQASAPTQHNVLTFSPSPSATLSISPHWLDLQTGTPWRLGAYSFSSPLLPKASDAASPWSLFLQNFKKEIPPAEWRAMEQGGWEQAVQRCFLFEASLELCLRVSCRQQSGYSVELTVRDTTFPTPEQRLASLRAAAEGGDAEAQYRLGWKYLAIDGGDFTLRPDSAQAEFWFRKAAGQGHAGAQVQLAQLQKTEAPKPEAHTPEAQHELGWKYIQGLDFAQAALWFRKAAEQGHADAQVRLGLMYAQGTGVPQEGATALLWLHKAAAQGNLSAFLALGQVYEFGQGLPRNLSQAEFWYRKAGPAYAQASIERVLRSMQAQGKE